MNQTLEARLQFLEDQFALTQLLNDYQRFSDRNDPQAWGNLWIEDAVSARMDGTILHGRKELAESAGKSMAQFDTRQHVLTNPTFVVDGDTAEGSCGLIYTGRPNGVGEGGYIQFGGSYRWTFRRTGGGWKIVTREMMIDWRKPAAV